MAYWILALSYLILDLTSGYPFGNDTERANNIGENLCISPLITSSREKNLSADMQHSVSWVDDLLIGDYNE